MLQQLTIRDFVIVDQLELEFGQGFVALTGETGAGKSILVDALAFVLGDRADSGVVRAGCERADVTAEFSLAQLPRLVTWLGENDLEADGALILRRVVDVNGRSRAYINGAPSTAQQVRVIAEHLIDIHGQHAHQSLLRSDVQRSLVDGHGRLLPLVTDVKQAWNVLRETKSALDAAKNGAESLEVEREHLDWQVKELSALSFSEESWRELNVEHSRLAHGASLLEGSQFAVGQLCDEEVSCESMLDNVVTRIDALVDFDPELDEVATLLKSAQAELGEAVSLLRRYENRLDIDPSLLSDIERRIEAVHDCARKYRVTPEEIPCILAKSSTRLAELGEAADVAALERRLELARQSYGEVAKKLSSARREAASSLSRQVSEIMQQLALSGGRLEVALIPQEDGSLYGDESIEFRIAGLSGVAAKSLAKVASGGELSRISLAIQVVTSKEASVPTLVFDEVDVGIGGGVAEIVGRLLRELSADRQVLCVTHLPQVAACAHKHWRVSKSKAGDNVTSQVVELSHKERVEEVARMLGGVEITPITLQHAQEMLAR